MRNALVIAVIGSTLWLTAPNTQALGFGRIANATQLGQPLNFSAMVQLGSDESLARECVSADVLSGDNKVPAGLIRVTLEPGGDASERSVRITSTALIDEPVVTITVTVGCSTKISRRFVALIDPPLINLAQSDAVDAAKLVPQQIDTQVTPLLAIVQAANGQTSSPTPARVADSAPPSRLASVNPPRAEAARKSAQRSTRHGERTASRGGPGSRSASAAPALRIHKLAAAGPARAASAGASRLQLEAAPDMAELAPSAPVAAASAIVLAQVAAAPSPSASEAALTDALSVERQRIQRLEEGSARMLSEAKATQLALAGLQARLQAAESERYANPLVYGLAALVVLLAAATAGLWWRLSRARAAPQWWVPPAEAAAAVAESAEAEAEVEPDAAAVALAAPPAVPAPNVPERRWEISDSLLLPAGSAREMAAADPATMPAGSADTSVEQLIDLEQQAEFFVVLGQDEAAVDLLMGHVRGKGGVSPLPYLKLLEIYRRCNDREAYERIRTRFNRRFSAVAPGWDADLQLGRSLADYPEQMGQLQALWRTPHGAMELLEASLFRRVRTDPPMDLPAYRELLFLFSIARDLSEHDEAPDEGGAVIDLLLPIEPMAVQTAALHDMTTTRTLAPLDFDVSMPTGLMPMTEHLDTAPAAMTVTEIGSVSGTIEFNDVPSQPAELAYRR